MNSDPQQFRDRSRTEAFFDLLRDRLLSIVLVILLVGSVAVLVGVDPEIPRWAKLVAVTAIAFVPVGYITGNWLTSLLYEPNYQFLVDLDAAYLDGAIYQFPPRGLP
jgi:hypothetical protein